MGDRLQGTVAVVTGSTSGIGRATALRFASEGAAVVVTGRTAARGEKVVSEIERSGGRAAFVPCQLDQEDDVRRVVDHAVERFGRLDVLVNNGVATDLVAPGGVDTQVGDLDTSRWDAIIRGCTTTVMWSCRAALPHLTAAGGGAIVNVSSAAASRGIPGAAAYQSARAATEALTRSIAVDYAAHNIRANNLIVGFVASRPSHEAMLADPVAGPAIRALHLTPVGRPDHIAAAALFLASDDAVYLTGTDLFADGGATSRMPVPDLTAARAAGARATAAQAMADRT
ncbi:SDR family NAD(P)-dependent oxidoreductase [Streptomyces sp. NPDC055400]